MNSSNPAPDQPTGMNELRERLEERIYAELVADNLNSTLRTENIMLYVDDYLAGIQQLVERCLPARDTRKHACPGADEHIQIGYNAAIDQVRRNLQQAGLLRGDELTQKPAEETEGQAVKVSEVSVNPPPKNIEPLRIETEGQS